MKRNVKTTSSGIHTGTLTAYLDTYLRTSFIKDFSANGLQVQGSDTVKKVALVVDASMEAFRLAVENNCQMIIAHHGIIWGGIFSIKGILHSQISFLLQNNLNLYASHLPLDLHPVSGNNAQIARLLNLKNLRPFGQYKGYELGFEGAFSRPHELDTVVHTLCSKLGSECTVLPFGKKQIRTVAIVSGGGGDSLTEAIEKNIDCFITGESDHKNYHAALEGKINVLYAGHYHTEKPGVQAIGALLEKEFGIKGQFFDIPTSI